MTARIAPRGVAHGSGQADTAGSSNAATPGCAPSSGRALDEHRDAIHLGLLQLANALTCYRQLRVVLRRVRGDAGYRPRP